MCPIVHQQQSLSALDPSLSREQDCSPLIEDFPMKVMYVLLIAVAALTMNAVADEPKTAATPVRTILERHDQSAVTPAKEIVIGSAMLPAGSAIGYHTHPGDEAGYVLKGTLVLKVQGQPDRPLKPGDSFFNPRGAVHSLVAAPGGDGGTAVSTWIIDKGQPLATLVP
jgi:quercetin dioxygenase-like cupin family protein